MRFLSKRYDGGKDSGVNGFWMVEIKNLFSIVLLKFNPNDRENHHSHAFNALTFWLKGEVVEERLHPDLTGKSYKLFKAGNIKYTPRHNIHKVHCTSPAWALCFRGPWNKTWIEYSELTDTTTTLTHGRVIL